MNSKILKITIFLLLSFGFFAPQKTLAFTLSKPVGGTILGLVGYWTFDGEDMLK